jgi:hypothetical protein
MIENRTISGAEILFFPRSDVPSQTPSTAASNVAYAANPRDPYAQSAHMLNAELQFEPNTASRPSATREIVVDGLRLEVTIDVSLANAKRHISIV